MSRRSSSGIEEDLPDLRFGEELSNVLEHVLQILVLLSFLQTGPVTKNELGSADEKRDGWAEGRRRKATTRSEREGRSSSARRRWKEGAHKGTLQRIVREAEANLRDL